MGMEPRMARERGIFRAGEDVIGKRVVNLEGEDLGKIEDVIIDAPNARVSYAILSFGGFLGVGDKLFALPWVSLFYSPENGSFGLKADKELLKRAPGFDRNNWPDLSDPVSRAHIYRYYGAEIYWS
jgi:PRC-barrel domain